MPLPFQQRLLPNSACLRVFAANLLVLAILPAHCEALAAQGPAGQATAEHRVDEKAKVDSPLDIEIHERSNALEAAKQSVDANVVKTASRSLAASALRRMGQVLAQLGDGLRAEDAYTRSVALEENAGTRLELCTVFLRDAKPDECLSETSKVILGDPQNLTAWRMQSKAYAAKKDSEHAATSLQQAEALQNDSSEMPMPPRASAKLSAQERSRFMRRQAELVTTIASALNDLGTAEARDGNFALALDHFHEAERWQPSLPGLERNIGLAADRVANYPEVVRVLRPVVASDPKDRLARAILGSALFSTHAFAEAAQTFTPLGESALEEPGIAYAWADSLVRLNRFHEAGALLDKLEQRPLTAEMFVLIAQARSQMGDYSHAVASCRRAVAADPQIPKAHYIAALALLREGRSPEAESELRSELTVDPNNVETQYNLAFVLLQQSRPQEALPWLKQVVARDPNHAQANYELGKQLLSDGNLEDAARYLEIAARLSPQLAHVHYQLQSAYRALGRREDADRELKIYKEIKEKARTPGASEGKP